jgi:hypothetical protein
MEVSLELLVRRELSTTVGVAFAPDVERTTGNLIGLDVLHSFNFALSHRNRVGYLRRIDP